MYRLVGEYKETLAIISESDWSSIVQAVSLNKNFWDKQAVSPGIPEQMIKEQRKYWRDLLNKLESL